MVHRALSVKEHTKRSNEAILESLRCNNSRSQSDLIVAEIVVHSNSICLVLSHCLGHFVSTVTLIRKILGHIIWQLRLEEIDRSLLPIPHDNVFESMFCRQSVHGHLVSVHNETVFTWIVTS